MIKDVEIIRGNKFSDDRGYLSFINDFQLEGYKRFYIVDNHSAGFIRAWHGHLLEDKAVLCLSGAALIGVVPISETGGHIERSVAKTYTLSHEIPSILKIPRGHANGFKSLTSDCKLLFFSSSTLEESQGDDYRFAYDAWNVWEEKYR